MIFAYFQRRWSAYHFEYLVITKKSKLCAHFKRVKTRKIKDFSWFSKALERVSLRISCMSLCRNSPEIWSASFDVFYLGQTRWTIQYLAEKKVLKSLTCTHFQQRISSFPLGKQCKTHFYHKIAKSARNEPRFGMRGDYNSINVTVKFQLDWQR